MPGKACLLALALPILALLASCQVRGPVPDSVRASKIASPSERPHPIPPPTRRPGPIPQPIPGPGGIDLTGLVHAAGMIFSGTVVHIERRPATYRQSVETVAITFHVENAIRGTVPGEDVTVLQWMGLWSSGQSYRPGERVLLFLYPRSKLGLTSSVSGPMGRFQMDGAGHVVLSPQQLVAFRSEAVLSGKTHAKFSDFVLAARRASEEE
jgi:hypothetical protein